MPDKPAYTVSEFAALFGKERTWGYRQIYAGKVDTVTIFGSIMVPVEEVEKVMATATRYGISGNAIKRKATKKKATSRKQSKTTANAWKKYLSSKRTGSTPSNKKNQNPPNLRFTRGEQNSGIIIRRIIR